MVKKNTVSIYVEGGGDHYPSLASDMRQGFRAFFIKAGFEGSLPTVIVCGGRQQTYNDYCLAVEQGKSAMLLVDSEAPILAQYEEGDMRTWKPWEQLQSRKNQKGEQCDKWDIVGNDINCQLMVQMMEAWFLADVEAVKAYFSRNFKEDEFPKNYEHLERLEKTKIESILNKATKDTKKGKYDKGRDSFAILGRIDPQKVQERSKWAKRFICLLKEKN